MVLGLPIYTKRGVLNGHLTNVNFQHYFSENILQIGPTYELHYCKLCTKKGCSKRVSTCTTIISYLRQTQSKPSRSPSFWLVTQYVYDNLAFSIAERLNRLVQVWSSDLWLGLSVDRNLLQLNWRSPERPDYGWHGLCRSGCRRRTKLWSIAWQNLT